MSTDDEDGEFADRDFGYEGVKARIADILRDDSTEGRGRAVWALRLDVPHLHADEQTEIAAALRARLEA